jgi:hypothetical protein
VTRCEVSTLGPNRARRASAPSEVSPASVLSNAPERLGHGQDWGATAKVRGMGAGGAALWSTDQPRRPAVPPNDVPQGRKRRRPFG